MSDLLVVNKIRQISHMEILQEGAKSEPRLRRLLGHISAYDNVEQWRKDNQQQIFLAETARYHQAQIVPVTKPTCQATLIPSSSIPKLRTLAQFQAAVHSHFEVDKETTVSAEEVFSESDSEEDNDETESDGSLEDDSDDESTWSEDDSIIQFINKGTRSLLQDGSKDDVVLYGKVSELALQVRETEKIWP